MFCCPADSSPFDAVIREDSWIIPPIFTRITASCYNPGYSGPKSQKIGAELLKTDATLKKQMFNTFNMGIGFVLALAPADVRQAIEHLDEAGFPAWEIGRVEKAAGVSEADNAKRELRFV